MQLSLVSGRPISFVSQLYAPRYVERPAAELADDRGGAAGGARGRFEGALGAQRVRVGGNVAGGRQRGRRRIRRRSPRRDRRFARRLRRGSWRRHGKWMRVCSWRPKLRKEVAPSSIVASASAGELGELFEYRIAQPVTIRKDESAMLPFLQQPIEARKLLIYSDHSSQHPTNAAELDQYQRQDPGWRPHHGLRWRRLRRRSAHGDPQGQRQAAHQLRRGPGNAHHRGLRQQAGRGARDPRQPRHPHHQDWPPKRRAPIPSATWTRRPRP